MGTYRLGFKPCLIAIRIRTINYMGASLTRVREPIDLRSSWPAFSLAHRKFPLR